LQSNTAVVIYELGQNSVKFVFFMSTIMGIFYLT